MLFTILLLIVTISLVVIIYKFAIVKEWELYTPNKKNNYVFLDLDLTITDIHPDVTTRFINYVLANGFNVGVVTASNRPIEMLCSDDTANTQMSPFMPDILCRELFKSDNIHYNNYTTTMGTQTPLNHEALNIQDVYMYGRRKGVQLLLSKQQLKADHIIMLDDQHVVCEGINQVTDSSITPFKINNKVKETSLDLSFNKPLKLLIDGLKQTQ